MNPTDVEIVLSLGSNCGDRLANVKAGIDWICRFVSNFRASSIYATPDCLGSQKEYFNAVVIGYSDKSPDDLERLCKQYEISCGRDDESRKANLVPIDIDIVIYGGEIMRPRDYARDFFQIGYKSLTKIPITP